MRKNRKNDAETELLRKINREMRRERIIDMKKGKKLLLTTVLTMLFTLFMGISVSAATADEPVVPTLVKKGDLPETMFRHDYQLKAGEGTMSIPVQITKTGTLTLGIMNKSEDVTIMAVLSSSADADNSNALITGGKLEPGKYIIPQEVLEKVAPRYIHIVRTDTEHMDKDITIRVTAFQQMTDVIKASQVKLSKTSVTWNGKAQKPWFTAKTGDGRTLDNEFDDIDDDYFTVKYSNNKNVGQATVTITFKEGYGGTVKKTFTIVPKGTTLSKVTGTKKGFTVKWKKQAIQTTGYEIQYSTSSKFKGAKTVGNIKAKTTSKNITKLKAGKKYYVRIRTYKTAKVNGKNTKLYSSWSKAKTVTTKK